MMFRPLALALLSGVVAFGVGGCHHDSHDPPPVSPPPPPPASLTPVASFTMASSAAVGAPIAVDASASSSPVSSPLTYGWSFGDGTRGGAVKQAKVFGVAGSFDVTLVVRDADGRSASTTHTVTITPGAAPGPTVQTRMLVADIDGHPLPGVLASLVNGTATATTDAQGSLTLGMPTGTGVLVKLSKAGYAEQFVPVRLPQSTGADAYVEARLIAREPSQPLADATAGGTLTAKEGTKITLSGGSLVDAAGNAVTGSVQIDMTPVDVTGRALGGFPGRYSGITPAAATTSIVSYGSVEFVLTQNGQRVQLAPGRTAIIELPSYPGANVDGTAVVAGATVPLWSLDETTGVWVQEGTGTVVASAGSPTGLALRATVGHFTWWNMDGPIDDDYKPKPHCEDEGSGTPGSVDHLANATICNVLAQFDGGGGSGSSRDAVTKLLAAAPAVQRPAFGGTFTVPIGGGLGIALPANRSMVLQGTALNGTWIGQKIVQGGATDTAEVVIPLHAVAAAPPDETITLPADITRSLAVDATTHLAFSTDGTKAVSIVLASGPGSLLTGQARLLQGGNVLATATFANLKTVLSSVKLPAGNYVIEITNTAVSTGTFQLQAAYVHWASQGSLITDFVTVDQLALAYDPQGRPVLMDAETYLNGGAGSATNRRIMFRRLVNGDWTSAAATVEAGSSSLTLSIGCVGFALDHSGNPAYVRLNADRTTYTVNRWSGTAWQTVGPNNGVLPVANDKLDCMAPPQLIFDATDTPFVALDVAVNTVGAQVVVVKYTGNAWAGVGPNNGRVTPANLPSLSVGGFAMALDATGMPVVEWNLHNGNASSQAAYVLRYAETPTPGWTGVGSANGQLPTVAGVSYSFLQGANLALDANGRPFVAAGVFTGSGFNPVVMTAFRFDGTQWSAADARAANPVGTVMVQAAQSRLGIVTGTGEPNVVWAEIPEFGAPSPFYYVQSWNGTSWTGLGSSDGRIDNPTLKLTGQIAAAKDADGNPAISYVRNPSAAGDTWALGVSVYTP